MANKIVCPHCQSDIGDCIEAAEYGGVLRFVCSKTGQLIKPNKKDGKRINRRSKTGGGE